jgi:hypothetical protein
MVQAGNESLPSATASLERQNMSWLADLILIVHFAFVLFVVGGLATIWIGAAAGWNWVRNFRFRIAHLAAICLVAAEALLGVVCPLTAWEDALRGAPGDQSFIARWLHRVLFYSTTCPNGCLRPPTCCSLSRLLQLFGWFRRGGAIPLRINVPCSPSLDQQYHRQRDGSRLCATVGSNRNLAAISRPITAQRRAAAAYSPRAGSSKCLADCLSHLHAQHRDRATVDALDGKADFLLRAL